PLEDLQALGSPPRVWGRRASLRSSALSQSVHPHACGDDDTIDILMTVNERFTPTRVGTTELAETAQAELSVHPHACRDDLASLKVKFAERGSPPRVWGRLDRCQILMVCLRFTPTRVGTTFKIAE